MADRQNVILDGSSDCERGALSLYMTSWREKRRNHERSGLCDCERGMLTSYLTSWRATFRALYRLDEVGVRLC